MIKNEILGLFRFKKIFSRALRLEGLIMILKKTGNFGYHVMGL